MADTVVVTGGTGYIAGFVIAELLNHGYNVRASVRDVARLEDLKATLAGVTDPGSVDRLTVFAAHLTSPDGWRAGCAGADGVIHVASPLGHGTETATELKKVAVGGTLTVLSAASEAGVRRVVMTSSLAACTPRKEAGNVVLDESFWSDPLNPQLDPYRLSKIASERAAWDYAKSHDIDLTTILPGAVFGPIMSAKNISTDDILLRLLNGGFPAALKVPFEISDVRDLAVLHRLAFENPAAIGQRFNAASQTITMPEIARLYRQVYPQSKAPRLVFPNWCVRLLARLMPPLRAMVPMLGREYTHTCAKAEKLLDWTQHTPQQTVSDAAKSLTEFGLVRASA